MATKDVVYVYPYRSSFVKKDIQFLQKYYRVIEQPLSWNKFAVPFSFLRQFFFLLFRLKNTEAIFVMFGGYWSVIPVLLGKLCNKKTILILGGTDCAAYPEINYGSLRKKILKYAIGYSVRNTSILAPVDDSLMGSYNSYYNGHSKRQGLRFFFPDLKTPFEVVYNGFDPVFWQNDQSKKPFHFISVAAAGSMERFVLKGFDLICDVALEFPDYKFTLVGVSEELKSELKPVPYNVTIINSIPQTELKKHLSMSEFYLQLSISEGFPNSLCEGMLAGCIPIGSAVNAIPSIIDDTGFILKKRDRHLLINLLNQLKNLGLESKKEMSQKAIKRIIENYPIEIREKKFLNIING